MSDSRKLSEKLKSAASVSSLASHSLLVVDADGNVKKASPNLVAPYVMAVSGSYVTDLDEATDPGLYMLAGSGQIVNGPAGVDLLVGMLEVYYRGGSTGTLYQRIITRYGIMATRARTNGSWSAWRILS